MNPTLSCPKCGTPLSDDAPAGLCPNCLVQAGFESETPSRPEPAVTTPSPSSAGFAPPTVEELASRFPQLEILELLGKGGMGAVYKARQPGLDRLVAVKILPVETSHDPTFAERFTREARALARLSHPNIVAIYDFGQTEGLYFFVMEYVDGVNLRQAIQAGAMTPQNTLTIVPQICDALQFAHDEGIIHRDIKPENILIDKRGRVKIADFGLAKLLGRAQSDLALTHTRQVMGTLRYMAPEQMEGSHEVDHRADIYSLGVVFYELLTGDLPIGRFAPPSKKVQIDVRLDEVVLRALENAPEQRYQHASDVKTDVETIARSRPPMSESESPAATVPLEAWPSRQSDEPQQIVKVTSPDARLSWCALMGAIWASYFCVALVVAPLILYLAIYSEPEGKISARSQPAPIGGGDFAIFPALHGGGELLKLILIIVGAVAGLIAVAAPFGTTILGFVAIGQVRRSAGRLYGLPLAAFDALLFPLLLLDCLIMVIVAALVMMVLMLIVGLRGSHGELASVLPEALTLLISLPVVACADYFVLRTAWRMISGVQRPATPIAPASIPDSGVGR